MSSLETARGKRDRAILSLLIGCGHRRAELVGLTTDDLQIREEHWVIADLIGKGRHIRTVPVPVWAKRAVDGWTQAAGITTGRIFRRVSRFGKIWGEGITPRIPCKATALTCRIVRTSGHARPRSMKLWQTKACPATNPGPKRAPGALQAIDGRVFRAISSGISITLMPFSAQWNLSSLSPLPKWFIQPSTPP